MRVVTNFLRVTFLWILITPYIFMNLGMTLNQLVLLANHDMFPVLMRDTAAMKMMPYGIDEEGHILMSSGTHLNALGDIFDFHTRWASIGDLTLDLGVWLNTWCPYVWGALVIRELWARERGNSATSRSTVGPDNSNESIPHTRS